ncbi:HNH endonuclease [Streptomyces sp. SKN60]|uniref:HNH endonuclease signature motif containing protein n=1 Tax=Streptomyces sp. SKN60 TaxID=2855506 RepID=UPI002245C130|nr:HNH endonuclease signature motif containing protein [Streptomyces sp. SKN60]MCX2181062.1 HNH endonuclease [Streptomyces sp. SKN60]
MTTKRSAVPRPLARQLFVEAGHRCAIPTCRATPLEIAHIVPWARVRRHEFHNMIVLCPNCHTRFDRGDIDRQAMFRYKELLRLSDPHHVAPDDPSPRAGLIRAYRHFQTQIDGWRKSISDLSAAIALGSTGFPVGNVKRCAGRASIARAATDKLGELGGGGIVEAADHVFDWHRRWADDVVDLKLSAFNRSRAEYELWAEERFMSFVALHEEVCESLDLDPTELDFFESERPERDLPEVSLGTLGLWPTDA